MGIVKIDISQFLRLYERVPVIDVRSPSEYAHARIPCAYSLPLFTDEERKVVGTLYKQQGREQAIKAGLDFFGVKMRKMVEEAETLLKNRNTLNTPRTHIATADGPVGNNDQAADTYPVNNKTVIVHCWRGGMRSAGVAWLLDLYGFKVYTLVGGYKAFRRWALQYLAEDHAIRILGGYTGSGKTEILRFMKEMGEPVVDLEGLAHHKGSAFGALGQPPQPSQEMFENLLASSLFQTSTDGKTVWLEDESQRIGLVNIPQVFWQTIRRQPVYFIDVPFEQRLGFIVEHYGKLPKSDLAAAITRIQKRLGGLETKTALNFLVEDNLPECFRILLKYYDKLYSKGLANRPDPVKQVYRIECLEPGAKETAQIIIKNKNTVYA